MSQVETTINLEEFSNAPVNLTELLTDIAASYGIKIAVDMASHVATVPPLYEGRVLTQLRAAIHKRSKKVNH